jgi:molybdopterin molybdotransferase
MLGQGQHPTARRRATLAEPLDANGPREHYMRARLSGDGIRAMSSQDSSLLSILSTANTLIVRPVGDGPRAAGETVEYIPL